MSIRRRRLVASACAAALAAPALAQQRAALADPLRLGVDRGLADAGLGRALVRAFGIDTGIAVKSSAAPASQLLEALERGELDLTLTDAPAAEERLVAAGLAHDRRAVAGTEFVLVGPAPARGQPDPLAGATGGIVAALQALHAAALPFVSANDGSGAHLAEQALWRAAQRAPAPPWYRAAEAGTALAASARALGAHAIVERALAGSAAPLAVRVAGDPALVVPASVLRAFRSAHPAAKLFAAWVAGPKGRRVVAGLRGFVRA